MATKTEKQNTPKLVTASARDLRISPRKMRLVTNLVRGKQVGTALTQLRFTNKKGAPMLVKLLQSAIANAENNFSLDPETLYIKSITCDMGKVLRRYFPRARGSAFVVRKKLAHVNVVLESKEVPGNKKSRFAILKRTKVAKDETVATTTQEETAGKEAATEKGIREKNVKTSEQVKANKVQQKRILFNRKSGE